jgi:glycine oxidase
MEIGIAGAGLLGRLLAWRLARGGHRVAVFDPAAGPAPRFDGHGAAAFSAAGMLSPTAELDHAGPEIAALGWRGIAAWQGIAARLGVPVFAQRGSLLVAHRSDLGAAQRVLARLACVQGPQPEPLGAPQLAALEPALHGIAYAWLLPGEALIDPPATLSALHAGAADVDWQWNSGVERVDAGVLRLADGRTRRFDLVFDVRGLGARPQLALRGVRGETVWLHLREHGLTRPVRLLHPRQRVYIVPRDHDTVFVGASEIESEDRSEVSLRSAVELMAAAHSVMPVLAEARIVRLDRNLRPALPDNAPHLEVAPGLVRINGLFRHGWLIAPALVDDALHLAGIVAAQEVHA